MTAASPLEELVELELNLPFAAQYGLTGLVTPRFGLAYGQAIERLASGAAYLAEADGATLCVEELPDRTVSHSWSSPDDASNLAVIRCYVNQDTFDILSGYMGLLNVASLDDVVGWMLVYASDLCKALVIRNGITLIYPNGTVEVIVAKYGR